MAYTGSTARVYVRHNKLVVIIFYGSRSQQPKNPGRGTLGDGKFCLMSLSLWVVASNVWQPIDSPVVS